MVGGRGNDTAQLGSGDDLFIWNPGDGNDVVDGQTGFDTLDFRGANIAEKVSISANGSHALFTRDIASITMDLNAIERVQFEALGGVDNIVVNDLTGTGVKQVAIDLAASGGLPDGQQDTVMVNGTAGNNIIGVTVSGGVVTVSGLPEQVTINAADADDRLVVNSGAGNDVIDASMLPAAVMALTVDGGAGSDTIIGSQGADMLIGGDGNDKVVGGRGNDTAQLGAGNDLFTWNPGDGSDTVEGQAGTDTLDFVGSNASENIDLSANGGRLRLFRDVGNITLDVNGVEHVQVEAAGGADNIVVNDLTGTDVTQVAVNLAAAGAISGDGATDTVTINGTAGNDAINVTASGSVVTVAGLSAQVTIDHTDAGDQLTISGLAGNDVINAGNLPANLVHLTLNGSAGNDVLTGSQGNDTVIGGTGNDVAALGNGDDLFIWNPGDGSDVVDGQGGFDTLDFRGANINENVSVSANGSHVLFTRDIASITMDLNAVERVQFEALGGADNIVVSDLTGTGVKQVAIDLAATLGGAAGDGQADTVTVNGTAGNNTINVTAAGTVVTVSGLSAQVAVDHADAGDLLVINGGGGNDTINASTLPAGAMALTFVGGAGNDVLIGGGENDTFMFTFGEGGQDVVKGFQAHGASVQGDLVSLVGFADSSFAQAVADGHIAQSGADVVVSDGTNVVATLQNVALASLHANDFLFS